VAMSASSTHVGVWLIETSMAPITSQVLRPGRQPSRFGAHGASPAGSRACVTTPCGARSAMVGIPPRAWLVRAGLGNVDPSSWRRFPVARQGVGQGQACLWREGREAIDARCLLASVVWRDLPYRSSCGMMGPEQALLKPADVPVITTWRGAVEALVARTHLPLKLRPADGMPWIHRAQCRAHHVCTPPRPLTFHTSGRTSAYPRALLVALAA
jgi:hypothetical protein